MERKRVEEIKKYLRLLGGLFMCALGCIMILRSDLGLAPWDVLHQGLSKTIGITIGQASIGLGITIVFLDIVLGQPIGLGTIINFICVGLFMDLIIFLDFIPVKESYIYRFIILFIGIFFYAYGTFFYMVQGMGCGPRDGFMQILTKKTKYPVVYIKNSIELFALISGWLLGGKVGVGTFATALIMGVFLQYIFRFYKIDLKTLKHRNIKEELIHLSEVLR